LGNYRKEVFQFSNDGSFIKKYDSLIEAGRKLEINHSSLMRTCQGKQVHTLDFIWIYKDEYNEELLGERIKKYNESKTNKGIIQLSKEGEFIVEYKDTIECAEKINGDPSAIIKCCRGKLKTHKGYHFKYKSEYYSEVAK
jgi:hypothetical protein